jgi:hypothetical protein
MILSCTYLYSNKVKYFQIDKTLFTIKLTSTYRSSVVRKVVKTFSNESIYVSRKSKKYNIYIVNIRSKSLARKKLYKYKKLYKKAYITNTFKQKRYNKSSSSRGIEKQNDYIKAVRLYDEEEFKLSNTLFNKLHNRYLADKNVNLYIAKNSLELEEYDEAVAALDRVFISDESNADAKLQMGKIYYEQDTYQLAIPMFIVAKRSGDTAISKEADEYIRKINFTKDRHRFFINAKAEYLEDDNIRYNSIDKISDWAHEETISMAYIFKLTQNVKISNILMYLNRDYHNYTMYDINSFIYRPSLSVIFSDKYLAKLTFLYNNFDRNETDYLQIYSVKPEFKYYMAHDVNFGFYYKYQRKSYDNNDSYDNVLNEIGISTTANFNDSSNVNILATYSEQKQVSQKDIEGIDNRAFGFSVKYKKLFFNDFVFEVQNKYLKTIYANKKFIGFEKNEVTEDFKYGVGLVYNIFKYLSFGAKYEHISVNSNIHLPRYKSITKIRVNLKY